MVIEEYAENAPDTPRRGILGSRAFTFARIGVSIAVVAGLIVKLSPADLLDTLRHANASLLLAALVAMLATQVLVIAKWFRLLDARGIRAPAMLLARCYCIGNLLSLLLPTAIGGDVYRVYRVQRQPGVRAADVAMSVLYERATGYTAMTMLGAVGAVFYYGSVWAGVAALAGGALLGGLLMLAVRRAPFPSLRQDHALRNLLAHRGELIAVYEMVLFSLLIQALYISSITLAGRAFGAHVSWGYWALASWLVSIAVLLPITIGGLGVRESSYSALIKHAGGTAAEGASTGFALALMLTVTSALILAAIEVAERLGYAPSAVTAETSTANASG